MERSASPTNATTSDGNRPAPGERTDLDFTDSAVDIDMSVPADSSTDHTTATEDSDQEIHPSAPTSSTSLNRIRQLGALFAVLEEGGKLTEGKRQKLDHTLTRLEMFLENDTDENDDTPLAARSASQVETNQIQSTYGDVENVVASVTSDVNESELSKVHVNLAAVVQSMRLRQQEQRHLHLLTVQKVEAVAQRCLFQEQQIHDLVEEMRSLRLENQTLGQENDRLQETVARLESEASMKEVAVSAMTSAVAGLEGWIQDANSARGGSHENKAATPSNRQRRSVIRGKGRFRGRHYVDDEHDVFGYGFVGQDAQELQDGVKAWIRGFKDVEDACNAPNAGRMKESYHAPTTFDDDDDDDDDWGDFETPANFVR